MTSALSTHSTLKGVWSRSGPRTTAKVIIIITIIIKSYICVYIEPAEPKINLVSSHRHHCVCSETVQEPPRQEAVLLQQQEVQRRAEEGAGSAHGLRHHQARAEGRVHTQQGWNLAFSFQFEFRVVR